MTPFSVREEPGALVVVIEDSAAVNDFRSNAFRDDFYQSVQSYEDAKVALDLGHVDFLSSSGVALLVGLKRRLDARQGRLVLFGIRPVVLDLLRITRLTQYFAFADSEAEALASLRSVPTA